MSRAGSLPLLRAGCEDLLATAGKELLHELHLAFPNGLQKRPGVRNVAEGVESTVEEIVQHSEANCPRGCLPEMQRAADPRMPDDAIKIRANREDQLNLSLTRLAASDQAIGVRICRATYRTAGYQRSHRMIELRAQNVELDGPLKRRTRGVGQAVPQQRRGASELPIPRTGIQRPIQVAQKEGDRRRVARVAAKVVVRLRQPPGLPDAQVPQTVQEVAALRCARLERALPREQLIEINRDAISAYCTLTRISSVRFSSSTCTAHARQGSKLWIVRRISMGCFGSCSVWPTSAASYAPG